MTFQNMINILEFNSKEIDLYVGCSEEKAKSLLTNGWKPNMNREYWRNSEHGGQGRYLYLTNVPENARWYGEAVLKVTVAYDDLIVDPEDGTAETVEDELNNTLGLPGSVCATKPLSKYKFSHHNE
jgi:hypothetical protein